MYDSLVCSLKADAYLGKNRQKIQSMHRDHVAKVPSGFEVLGSSALCPVQAMRYKDLYLTTQGHPEFVAGHVELTIR